MAPYRTNLFYFFSLVQGGQNILLNVYTVKSSITFICCLVFSIRHYSYLDIEKFYFFKKAISQNATAVQDSMQLELLCIGKKGAVPFTGFKKNNKQPVADSHFREVA